MFLGMMSGIFLLQLIISLEGLFGAEHETMCTSNACFTLHMNKVSFEKASQDCLHNGGYLMTVRNQEEEDVLRSLLAQIQGQPLDEALPFWIGLKLHRGNCVLADQSLRGFKWESGDQDSNYSNWEKEPHPTCTERCAKILYSVWGQNQLKWTAQPCKRSAFYTCAFYFKGMCRPLALMGPGEITYTAPFSEEPQRSDMQLFPLGTYAVISCGDQPSHDQPYSVCQAVDTTYRWHVPGPFCKTGKRYCATNNGGCEHLCRQDAEQVRCFCREGFDPDEDGLACRAKAACGAETCEHQCVITESGYSCRCLPGFELDVNQRNCSDVDECKSAACRDHLCLNTQGSYTCQCRGGYRMVGDECVDIDECTQTRCEHSCSNSMGAFSCNCNEGFSLSADGHSCVDVDECVSGLCQIECVNTAGSYSCSCPRGFHVDGSTCAPDAEETSAASTDGPPNSTESLTRTTVELQHQSPHTDATLLDLGNDTHRDPQSNTSSVEGSVNSVHFRVIVCVLGSVIPLLLLAAVTLTVALFRCRRTKKEAKKSSTADGYCWVPSGLDQRLEKLYDSILTDDL
ncbi:thrombomodulin [Spinachia spinachia]